MHEAELRRRRQDSLAADIRLWTERGRAAKAFEDLGERLERAQDEHQRLLEAPDTYLQRRRALIAEVEEAEAKRKEAADHLADAETGLSETTAPPALPWRRSRPPARPAPGSQARHEAAVARLAEITRTIAEDLETIPGRPHRARRPEGGDRASAHAEIESKLHSLKNDRERLGAVNLRADEELTELETKHNGIAGERDDLVEAIKRLRQAIGSLNREGRERLLAAFDVVNNHFQRSSPPSSAAARRS